MHVLHVNHTDGFNDTNRPLITNLNLSLRLFEMDQATLSNHVLKLP